MGALGVCASPLHSGAQPTSPALVLSGGWDGGGCWPGEEGQPSPTPQVSALLIFLRQFPVHLSLDLGKLQLDPQSLGLLQLQGPLGCRADGAVSVC